MLPEIVEWHRDPTPHSKCEVGCLLVGGVMIAVCRGIWACVRTDIRLEPGAYRIL